SWLVVAVTACGTGTGTLTGKVSYQGKPVVTGSVLVRSADGSQRVGNIEPDGSYTGLNVPVGPVKLGIDSPEPLQPKAPTRRSGRPSSPAVRTLPRPPTEQHRPCDRARADARRPGLPSQTR